MIHFDVKNDDGDRYLTIEGTHISVGYIEQGRQMISSRKRYTEWAFSPDDATVAQSPVRDNNGNSIGSWEVTGDE